MFEIKQTNREEKERNGGYMIANYHTHTYRCGHAEGDEREYVEQAVKAGIRILGFSDHTPYDFFDSEPRNRPMRMKPEELPGYADSIRSLAEEFRDRIEIHLGVEAEYYPKYFPRLLEMLRENAVEYMILGQHFLGNEIGEPYSGKLTEDEIALDRYVSQTIDGMQTGCFTYFAHPDLIRFAGSGRVYEKHMRKLCRAAKDLSIPLEINILGLKTGRNYPDKRFWQIAAEEGNDVVLGVDAHEPLALADAHGVCEAQVFAEQLGLKPIEVLCLRDL